VSGLQGWDGSDDWGQGVSVDQQLESANADDYDALLLPGDESDKLRINPAAVRFVRSFVGQESRCGDLPRTMDSSKRAR
jgi:protease I